MKRTERLKLLLEISEAIDSRTKLLREVNKCLSDLRRVGLSNEHLQTEAKTLKRLINILEIRFNKL